MSPRCPQGGRNIREATADIREVRDRTVMHLAPTTQGVPDHLLGWVRPQMDMRENLWFWVTYHLRGLSPPETNHTHYPRPQKVYLRRSGFFVDIRDLHETCVGRLFLSRVNICLMVYQTESHDP